MRPESRERENHGESQPFHAFYEDRGEALFAARDKQITAMVDKIDPLQITQGNPTAMALDLAAQARLRAEGYSPIIELRAGKPRDPRA